MFCKVIELPELGTSMKYIHANPQFECYTPLHVKYLLLLIFPALIIWSVAIPLFLFYLLYKNKKKMGTDENNFKFGMLTEEYKPKKYYWEFFKMSYKMLL